ncbi:MAG TPA: FkbM family methyltransferase [Puia sp.]|nr:FkbM family methyltransferase [Puia sp.]
MRKLVGYHLASSGLFDNYFKKYTLSPAWKLRLDTILSSDDNNFISRIKDSGIIKNGMQIMHNNIKINLGSYYGPEYAVVLFQNKGVHEPQEERVFAEALKTLPPNSVMIEMGAFWSFYSMWFNKEILNAKNFMIEPDAFNMGQGKRNFKLNKMSGDFVQAFVGSSSDHAKPISTIAIDDFLEKKNIPFVHMLHSDIQGFEYEMLLGSKRSFSQRKIGYVFISTHSNDIHYKCLDFLKERDFIIIASADLNETFSEDGLIAARAPYFEGIDVVDISKKESK